VLSNDNLHAGKTTVSLGTMQTNRLTTDFAEMVGLLGFEPVIVSTLTASEVMKKITASILMLKYIIENFTPKITSYLIGRITSTMKMEADGST